jgi:hypothetical protein
MRLGLLRRSALCGDSWRRRVVTGADYLRYMSCWRANSASTSRTISAAEMFRTAARRKEGLRGRAPFAALRLADERTPVPGRQADRFLGKPGLRRWRRSTQAEGMIDPSGGADGPSSTMTGKPIVRTRSS